MSTRTKIHKNTNQQTGGFTPTLSHAVGRSTSSVHVPISSHKETISTSCTSPAQNQRFGQQHAKCRGFTLIEMMVSVSIFTVVMIGGIGMLFTVSDAFNNTRARGNAINAVGSAVEHIAREIRTGSGYDCVPDANSDVQTFQECWYEGDAMMGTGDFKFLDQEGRWIEYSLSGNNEEGYSIQQRCVRDNSYQKNTVHDACGDASVSEVNTTMATSSDFVKLKEMNFYVDGLNPGDGKQPVVTIVVEGEAVFKDVVENFVLETTVVQRVLDDVAP